MITLAPTRGSPTNLNLTTVVHSYRLSRFRPLIYGLVDSTTSAEGLLHGRDRILRYSLHSLLHSLHLLLSLLNLLRRGPLLLGLLNGNLTSLLSRLLSRCLGLLLGLLRRRPLLLSNRHDRSRRRSCCRSHRHCSGLLPNSLHRLLNLLLDFRRSSRCRLLNRLRECLNDSRSGLGSSLLSLLRVGGFHCRL